MIGLLIRVLLWVLPVVILIMVLRYRQNAKSDQELLSEKQVRIVQYGTGGLILLFFALLYGVLTDDNTTRDADYVPPQLVDGEIVPGHFEENTDTGEPDADNPETPEDDG